MTSKTSESAKAKKLILHIEDDNDFLQYVQFILEDIANIEQATSLQQSRNLLRQKRYDLILLDLHLPDGTGMEIVNELAVHHPEIPIVIFSIEKTPGDIANVAKIFQKGAFSERSLINAIRVLAA